MKNLFAAIRKLYVLILAALLGFPIMGWSQADVSKKYSISTQMFLAERDGKISAQKTPASKTRKGLKPNRMVSNQKRGDRFWASPDTIEGKAYISSFVRLKDSGDVDELEAMGVQIQETFANGLVTALIPVERVEDVAAIANVKRISVARCMKAYTDEARAKTNTDDLLTLSADAIAEGLSQQYDGTGVVLGVIDTGIDFQHIAFKDKDGNSRIKRAYVYNGSSANEYTTISSTSPTTDDSAEDHGSHTATTAGGSSVIVSGSTVTVTDDHASASYGGMAPGADLYLAGIKNLSDTYLSNAVNKMVQYADAQGKPLVVSNSWGSQWGPHDGTGETADVYNSLFGDSHPNRIALFAASNDGAKSKDNEGGGYHISGTASSSNPLGTILRSSYYSNTDAGYFYSGLFASAWARSSSVGSLSCKIFVLNSSTGAVLSSVTVTPTAYETQVTGLSSYYTGTLYVLKDYVDSDKTQLALYAEDFETTSSSGSSYYKSDYTLAAQFYPTSGSAVIDVWGGNDGYFTNHLTTSGYTWTAGSDDMCVSDEATISNAISVGAYVSKNIITDYNGDNHYYTGAYTMGDIADFSSYATAAESPTGLQYPWITAPGARLVAGVNHYHTTSVDEYSYYGTNYNTDLVVNNSNYPYAAMEGTSMATPTAAGIVALWLQASLDENAVYKNLTVNNVKEIMRETAITDSYTTTGANASHFGNGKIDALAGIQYILGSSTNPKITASSTALSFADCYATKSYTQTITVTGKNLEGNITVAKSGNSAFTVDQATIAQTGGSASATLTITYAPTAAGTHVGTLTLTSSNAETVTVSLTGTAAAATPAIVSDKASLSFSAAPSENSVQTITVTGRFLTEDVSVALTDANGVFSVDKTTLSHTTLNADGSITVSVTFNSSAEGDFTGTLTLSSASVTPVAITLTASAENGGTAADAYLNVARYKTIDDEGWTAEYVTKIYKYTTYTSENVEWLTLPIYGAWLGGYYNSHPQKWIDSNVTNTSNKYAGTTWSSTDKFMGSSTYFSSKPRGMGYNSGTNSVQEVVNFYVTNITAVKMLGVGTSKATSTYPASLKIYECTKNANGTLTPATTATQSYTNSATSGTFTLSATGLSTSKIYKVETATYRSLICEVAFETPLATEPEMIVDLESLTFSTPIGTEEAKDLGVLADNLEGPVSVSLTDANGVFSIDQSSVSVADAENGHNITVTFAPTVAGNYSGTITLSTEGTENITVALTATATTPEMIADPMTLEFSTVTETPVNKTFDIQGADLAGDVTVTLGGTNSAQFSVDAATVTKAQAEAAHTITVTYNPTESGSHSATVTLSSLNAEDVVINLSGSAMPGYFDVAVSGYGLSTMYLDFPVEIPYDTDEDLLGVYYVKSVGSGEVKLARLAQYVPANQAVIVQGNSGTHRFMATTDAAATTAMDGKTNLLLGCLQNTSVSAIDVPSGSRIYTLGKGENAYVAFYRYSGSTLAANKAYLIYDESAGVKELTITLGDDNATLMESPNAVEGTKEQWFTLQGVRLNRTPAERGVYIKNGKKVVVK